MRPRVFIHVGLHKTGTTSFQNYLADHRDELRRHGILVPRTGVPPEYIGGQHQLPWSLIPSLLRTLPWADAAGAWRDLREEIDGSGCGRVILSSEEFSRLDGASIATLAEHLSGMDLVPVLVLRRTADVVEGSYRTYLMASATETFAEFVASQRVRRDYAAMAADWCRIAAMGEMVIVSYDDPAVGADTVAALMGLIVPDVAVAAAEARERANPGKPAALIELVRLMRSQGVPTQQLWRWMAGMEKAVAAGHALADDRFMPPATEAAFDRAYRDDVARILAEPGLARLVRSDIPLPPPRPSATIDGPVAALLRLPDLLAASGHKPAVPAMPDSLFPIVATSRPGRVSGHLDQPQAADGIIAIDRRRPLDLAGWLFEIDAAAAATRILQFQPQGTPGAPGAGGFIVPLLDRVPRRDVAEAFPGVAIEASALSGFTLCLDPRTMPAGPYRLRLGVADGTGIAYAGAGYAVDLL